jgi:glycosyltransferase involved in cell wall biosynthesis
MRILNVVHQYLPEQVGGTELYTHWVAGALSRRGQEVTVFYRRSAEGIGEERRTEGNVHIWSAWTGRQSPTRRFLATFGDPPMVQTFERALDEIEPDLIHIQHLMGMSAGLIHSIRRRGIPYVVTLWDFWWICANAQLLTNYSREICDGPKAYLNCARCVAARSGRRWLNLAEPALAGLCALRNRVLRQILGTADRLIAPTPFVHRWYADHTIPENSLVTLIPGLEYTPTPSPQKRETTAPIRFAYIGGLSWQKGIHTLIEAFGKVQGQAELWIAGDESFDPDYVARLRALATPQVRFLGRLTREEVWQTLAQVDVVTVPTLWYETFSFIVSEAFASGIPAVVSNLGPLSDRVRDGVDGLSVPAGDATAWRATLQRLVDDKELRAHLQANVERPMTLEQHVDHLEALYARCVSG